MPFFDMPLHDLEQYQPTRQETADFDTFWQRTLDESRQYDLNATFETADFGLKLIETYDVTFAGYDGQAVAAQRTQRPLALCRRVYWLWGWA